MQKTSYQKIYDFVNQATSVRKTHKINLALLAYGIMMSVNLIVWDIAKWIPIDTSFKHKDKRLRRFLSNKKLDNNLLREQIAKNLICLWSNRQIAKNILYVIIDQTKLLDKQYIYATIPYHRRAIPIAYDCFDYQQIRQSKELTSQNIIELNFARWLKSLMPDGVKLVIIADRGYAKSNLFKELSKEGIGFIIRTKGNVTIYKNGKASLLRNYKPSWGKIYWLGEVLYQKDEMIPLNVAISNQKPKKKNGKKSEVWYIATNLEYAQAFGMIKQYKKRMWIEEMFRDFKEKLKARKILVKSQMAIQRLLICMMISFCLLAAIGVLIMKNIELAKRYFDIRAHGDRRVSVIHAAIELASHDVSIFHLLCASFVLFPVNLKSGG